MIPRAISTQYTSWKTETEAAKRERAMVKMPSRMRLMGNFLRTLLQQANMM